MEKSVKIGIGVAVAASLAAAFVLSNKPSEEDLMYEEYVLSNGDLINAFELKQYDWIDPSWTIAEFGKYHYENWGRAENRKIG
jgi:hypothetical protein